MEHETTDRPAARRSREAQRERVEALLEEQRRREERTEIRRTRFRKVLEEPSVRTAEQWTPLDP